MEIKQGVLMMPYLLYMICKDSQPFNIVENEGFQYFTKIIAPQYKLPSRNSITRWIDDKYDSLSKLYIQKLKGVENITLTTDISSDNMQMRSFLGITAHFAINIESYSITLGVYELDMRHTSDYIAEKRLITCVEWEIGKETVSAVVTDNAANIVKAIDIAFTKRKHIPCFAHTLNLIVQSGLQFKDLQEIITKMRAIITWFKQSCIASDALRKAVPSEKKLIQDVPTRWNSTYYMMERFLDLQSFINDTIIKHKSSPPMLSGMELSIVTGVIPVLRPLEAATKEISAEKYTTSSKVIPLV
ncbi:hypothetical protein ABEB36_003661 [Hypothenemus hampei]|uniref:Uncharacterized protein n=1 Tax=Hypothenemus hampei TaxID=57062 RepID=A0ABD1FCK4_HYPHA